jgi:hypothetical protein
MVPVHNASPAFKSANEAASDKYNAWRSKLVGLSRLCSAP